MGIARNLSLKQDLGTALLRAHRRAVGAQTRPTGTIVARGADGTQVVLGPGAGGDGIKAPALVRMDEVIETARAEIAATGVELLERFDDAMQLGADAATAAGSAAATASTAQEAADTATQTATEANQAALDAAGLAGSKGKVIYQASAPTGTRANPANLWIRTSDNRPHTYNGTTWVAVTDKAATDAAAAAVAAGQVADAARQEAEAAHALAGDANTTANAALTSANSKTRLYRSTATASGTGTTVGDTWWRFEDATWTRIIGQWVWSGTSWIAAGLGHQVIGSVDIGVLTVVGTATLAQAVIDVLWAQVVRARKITTDMLLVGSGINMVPGGGMQDADLWSAPAGSTWGSSGVTIPNMTGIRNLSMRSSAGNVIVSELAQRVRVRVRFVPSAAMPAGRLSVNGWGSYDGVTYVDSYTTGTVGATHPAVAAGAEGEANGVFNLGANYSWFTVSIAAAQTGTVRVISVEIMPDIPSLIVTGGLTADHIATDAVDARVLRGDAVDGKTITGATLQTSALANRGVKFRDTGIFAYNASGTQMFWVDSATGFTEMVGGFQTASNGPRLRAYNGQWGGYLRFYTDPAGSVNHDKNWGAVYTLRSGGASGPRQMVMDLTGYNNGMSHASIILDEDAASILAYGWQTSNATAYLTVRRDSSWSIPTKTASNVSLTHTYVNANGDWNFGGTGNGRITYVANSGGTGYGAVTIAKDGGHFIDLNANGWTYLRGHANVSGQFTVNGTKNFVMPHPTKPGWTLRHASTESPHNGVEYWSDEPATIGADGMVRVELPEYFGPLTSLVGRAVFLTAHGPDSGLWSEEVDSEGFTVHGAPGTRFSWLVKARRVQPDSDGGDALAFEVEYPEEVTPPPSTVEAEPARDSPTPPVQGDGGPPPGEVPPIGPPEADATD